MEGGGGRAPECRCSGFPGVVHRQHHEAEDGQHRQLYPEVVPGGRPEVVEQAAFDGAALGVAVVGAQPDVDGDDADDVQIHQQQGAEVVPAACPPAQQDGDGQRDDQQQAMGNEEDEEGYARVAGCHVRCDEGLDARCQYAEVHHGAGPVGSPPQGDEGDDEHEGAEVQRQVVAPRAVGV